MRFPRDFSSNPEIAKRLHAAAAVIFSNPVAAVDETRRALEAAARSIYRSSFGNDGPRPFHELAAELRGNALLPDGDWHLMKNLWSRASGAIHEGKADSSSALWIWLGTAQFAELVRPNQG